MTVKIQKGTAAGIINLTPMIDVVFQLLLFFLIATRFAEEERELDVVLPQASEAKPLIAKTNLLFVNIDREGRYFLNRQQVDLAVLETTLRQAAANNPGRRTVEVRADKRCAWEHVAAVVNLCTKVGLHGYRITTQGPSG
jgi:biopolymer transport protein ExbD